MGPGQQLDDLGRGAALAEAGKDPFEAVQMLLAVQDARKSELRGPDKNIKRLLTFSNRAPWRPAQVATLRPPERSSLRLDRRRFDANLPKPSFAWLPRTGFLNTLPGSVSSPAIRRRARSRRARQEGAPLSDPPRRVGGGRVSFFRALLRALPIESTRTREESLGGCPPPNQASNGALRGCSRGLQKTLMSSGYPAWPKSLGRAMLSARGPAKGRGSEYRWNDFTR